MSRKLHRGDQVRSIWRKRWRGTVLAPAAHGAILIRWDTLTGRVGRRQMQYGTNTVVLSLVVLGILGTVNYLVARNNKRWDLTGNQRFSLAPQTKKVLAALEEDATITYFQREGESSLVARDRRWSLRRLRARRTVRGRKG